MSKKYGLWLSACLLAVSMSSSNAAVISDQCTNIDDGYGGYSGVSCTYEYSFDLIGTVELQDPASDTLVSQFPIFGTLSQSGWYEEDYYGGNNAGETTTMLSLTLGNALSADPAIDIVYDMTRVDTLFDFATTIGPVTESLTNTSYYIGSPTNWFIETDGVNLILESINGINLMNSELPDFIAMVNVTPVPVPAALWLFASGLIGLAGLARRKR